MRRIGTWLAAGLVAASLIACQKEDPATKEKLDKLLTEVTALRKDVSDMKAGGGMRQPGPQQPRPGQPDATAVYSVPIDGDAVKGSPKALVTIVEAAEFA
jgi:protein-disulfide isomerase